MRQQTGTCKNARNQSVVLLWPFESVTRELIYFGWHQITSCYHLSMVASREAVKENIRCFCSLLLLSYLRVLSQSSYCVNQMRHLSSAPILQTKRQTGMKTSFIHTVFHAFIYLISTTALTHQTSTPETLPQARSVLAAFNSPCWVRLLLLKLWMETG